MPPTQKKTRRSDSIRLPVKAALHSTTNFAHFLKNKLRELLGSTGSHVKELHDIEQLISKGEFNEALNALELLEKREELSTTDQIICYILKSNLMNNLGHFEEGLRLAEVALNESHRIRKHLHSVDALIAMTDSLIGLGRYDEGLNAIGKGEYFLNLVARDQSAVTAQKKPTLLLLKGSIYWRKGELDQAIEFCQKSLVFYEKINNKRLIADALSHLGIIYRDKGELDRALEHSQRSLALQEETVHTQAIATSLNNIGLIYRDKGELDRALEYYKQSLEYFKEISHNLNTAASLNNIGEIHTFRGELDQAITYHEQSLDLSEKIGNNLWTSFTLFYLVSVAIGIGSLERAQQYLQYLQQINKQEDNKVISQQSRVAEALVLKNSPRARNRGKAEELLTQVIEEEIVQHEVTIVALLNLCDLLIAELRVSGTQEVLEEVKVLVNQLLEIANQQHSHWVLAETYVLQSKLALIELDMKAARQSLDKAQLIAEKRGLRRLAMQISTEHDTLLGQLKHWEDIIDRNASMNERVELAQLENILMQMIQKRAETTPELPQEEPLMLLIITEGGITLFSKFFHTDHTLEDQLIGGFLAAINAFIREAFAVTGSIERIMHQDYTLLLNSVEPFLVCYVFEGPSYFALPKLEQFTKELTSTAIWHTLTGSIESGIPLDANSEILELVAEMFPVPVKGHGG